MNKHEIINDASKKISANLKFAVHIKELSTIPFSSKPNNLSNIKKIPLTNKQHQIIDKLPKYDIDDLFDKGKINEEFKIGVPQYFVIIIGNQHLLVNTEGYDYVRYAIKI